MKTSGENFKNIELEVMGFLDLRQRPEWMHDGYIRYLHFLNILLERHRPEKVNSILEWGTGFSTKYLHRVAENNDAGLLLTIDHKADYQRQLLNLLPPADFLVAVTINLVAQDPNDSASYNYATYPLKFETQFDIVFVDGRRRNECLLVASNVISETGIVILHDANRRRYLPGRNLFKLEKDYDGFAVMKRKILGFA
jgi:predicted O-methyltransferase YrrM